MVWVSRLTADRKGRLRAERKATADWLSFIAGPPTKLNPVSETIWLTLQVGREVKHNQTLGEWDTRTLAQGDYMLRLVATDNKGEPLATCIIRVRVVATQEVSEVLQTQMQADRWHLYPGKLEGLNPYARN